MRDFTKDIGLEFKEKDLTVKYIVISNYLNGLRYKQPSPIQVLWRTIDNCRAFAPTLYYHLREFMARSPEATVGCLYFKKTHDAKDEICVLRHEPYTYISNKVLC